MSASKFYFVMIYEFSLDSISLFVISSVLLFLWTIESLPNLYFTFSILEFILDRVLIIF